LAELGGTFLKISGRLSIINKAGTQKPLLISILVFLVKLYGMKNNNLTVHMMTLFN